MLDMLRLNARAVGQFRHSNFILQEPTLGKLPSLYPEVPILMKANFFIT